MISFSHSFTAPYYIAGGLIAEIDARCNVTARPGYRGDFRCPPYGPEIVGWSDIEVDALYFESDRPVHRWVRPDSHILALLDKHLREDSNEQDRMGERALSAEMAGAA
jgi:hypothetical protein